MGKLLVFFRDPIQQNEKPGLEWGDYYAYKTNRESYFDRRSQQFFPSASAIHFKALYIAVLSTVCIL